MRQDPKAVGERSEAMIISALLRIGRVVLKPFGDNQRYDIVLEDDGKFTRVQCKTARVLKRNPAVMQFDACSSYAHRGGKKKGYRGQADVFAVYCPALDKVYLVPVVDVGTSSVNLRILPSKVASSKIRYARDYELGA